MSTNNDPVPMEDSSANGTVKKKPTKIEEIYQKKSQLEHILLRPDTYIGSVEPVSEKMWVFEDGKMVNKQINYVPGLYKIFDEILVNAADNKQRDKNMDTIKIDIDQDNNTISIYNNGQGIPIVEHKEEKMYVPTLIFGHLLTSSNFNDDEKKTTGGRNGYGAKLCNVFSTKFTVETANKKERKVFKQVWENNMSKAHNHKISERIGDDFTCVTFQPDLKKFGMETLDNDIVALFQRRAYDVAGTSPGVKVLLNGKRLPVKNFKDYVDLFLKDLTDEADNPVKSVWEKVNDRWEIAVCPSEDNFQQLSFVNSIATTKGGRHVEYISDMICKHLVEGINKKNKGGITVKPFQIKNHLWVFVNALIENPTFDSQTKETMTLQARQFGSKCEPSPKFFTSLTKSGIMENVLSWAKFKQDQLKDKTGGKKTNKIKGIPKLEDANDAGTRFSLDCTLVLTEGDSAKSLAVAGLGVVGRDKYGVFPLRGKLLNVREASHKQIVENAEINAMVKILGLKYKQKYDTPEDMKSLRYGKLMIMTDQDHDGSHIKGLIINFIHHNWPSLLKRNFIEEFITPIVKVTKGDEVVSFYSMPELEDWKTNTHNWKTYRIKYYKGLGTSTSAEAKEYFTNIERHRIKFRYAGSSDDDTITMAFSKKCIEQRKDWLTNWMENCKHRKELGLSQEIIYGSDVRSITYAEFVNKELVLFSNLDNERSIPCLVDGLKPGQRKVLFTCFKRNDKREVKVAQLAGSVAEHSAYHHGEVSLMSTIINLAQNYVGSNNINLLEPNGQFGTRLQGGKDSASPRYIFTLLSPLARLIFNPLDKPLLKDLYDDNQRIEPEWYCPIIPMVLVNGADGIGTGWMTRVPNFNPREIVENLRKMIRGDEPQHMKPWYKNFRGEIIEVTPQKYAINGEVAILDTDQLEISELPIGTWTQAYKENVVEILANGNEKTQPVLTGYKEYNTDTTVRFVLSVKPETMKVWEKEGFHRSLKLQSTTNLTSMVLFDKNGCLKRYESPMQILKEFFDLRMHLYVKRREYLIGMLTAEALKLSNQARFINEKCDGDLSVENKKKKVMIEELIARKYDSDPVKAWQSRQKSLQEQEHDAELRQAEEEEAGEAKEEEAEEGKDFDYLLQMRILSLTYERRAALMKERDAKKRELEIVVAKTPADLYEDDLNGFMTELDKVEQAERVEELKGTKKAKFAKQANKRAGKGAGGKAEKRLSIAHADTQPSEDAERIQPLVDDLLKKEEAKKGKGEKKPRVKKEKKEDMDEFDAMADDKDSLFDKIQSSAEGKKVPAKKRPAAGTTKKAAGGSGGAKKNGGTKKTDDSSGGPKKNGGLKQTTLNFGKKAAPASPKSKKVKKVKEYDSTGSDEEMSEDTDYTSDNSCNFIIKKDPPPKKVAEVKIDSDDDEDQQPAAPAQILKKVFPGAAKAEPVKKKAPLPKENDGFDLTSSESEDNSDSDSDHGKGKKKVTTKKAAPARKPAAAPAQKQKRAAILYSSDSDGDDFLEKSNGKKDTGSADSTPPSPKGGKPAAPKRAVGARAPAQSRKYKINSDSDESEDGFKVSDDESSEDEYKPSPSKKRKV